MSSSRWRCASLVEVTGRASYAIGLVRSAEHQLADDIQAMGLSRAQYINLVDVLAPLAEAIYASAWVNGSKDGRLAPVVDLLSPNAPDPALWPELPHLVSPYREARRAARARQHN